MADSTLLHELCGVCNQQTPRYRCPRCSARTCSLPCYKRHQQWSQCSGKRDRAAFVSKNKLATPAGIDHDYNFLSSIERSFDVAQRTDSDKRVPVHQARSRDGNPETRHSRNLRRHYRHAQVVVEHAPVGMARQKLNKTQWNGTNHCISWTVEWIDRAGKRTHVRCDDTLTVADAHARAVQQNTQSTNKKRKRDASQKATTEESRLTSKQDPALQTSVLETSSTQKAENVEGPISVSNPLANRADEASPLQEPLHFYLCKTHTRSIHTVLIPLASSDTISTCLKNRIILEFPTIYVLPSSPDLLPEPYISESQYFRRRRAVGGAGISINEETQKEAVEPTTAIKATDATQPSSSAENESGESDGEDEEISDEEEKGPIPMDMTEPVVTHDGTALDCGKTSELFPIK